MKKKLLEDKKDFFTLKPDIPEELKPAYEICLKAYKLWTEGKIVDTITLLEEALALFQKVENYKDLAYKEIANILDFLGDLYHSRGNIEKALKVYKACLDICENFDDEISTAIIAEKIVFVYKEKKEYDKMLPYLYRLLEIGEKYNDAHRAARALVGIGEVSRYKKDYQTAKEALEIAYKIYKGMGAGELSEIVKKGLKELEKEMQEKI